MIFMVLGSGTLFGGLAVPYDEIPIYLKWAYYTSVPAITFRFFLLKTEVD